jgi:hypothetical protein
VISHKRLWSADTIIDRKLSYSSTGNDLAVIGNSGADMDKGGVRGYVSAYDVETGKLAWRFYTVPGPPGQPPEGPWLSRRRSGTGIVPPNIDVVGMPDPVFGDTIWYVLGTGTVDGEMFAQYAQEGKQWHKAAAVREKPILPAGSNKGD